MSTTLYHPTYKKVNTQNKQPILEGVSLGVYKAFFNGKPFEVLAKSFTDALIKRTRMIDEMLARPTYQIDWWICPDCRRSVDIGVNCMCGTSWSG